MQRGVDPLGQLVEVVGDPDVSGAGSEPAGTHLCTIGNQPRNRRSRPGNDDIFTPLDPVEKFGEVRLGGMDVDKI